MDELLVRFIKTAELGDLKLGLYLGTVARIMNVPPSEIFAVTRRRDLYEAGDLQLSFFKKKLDIISVKIRSAVVELPAPISDRALRAGARSFDEVVQFLEQEQIVLAPDLSYENLTSFKAESGVEIWFTDMVLSAISVIEDAKPK